MSTVSARPWRTTLATAASTGWSSRSIAGEMSGLIDVVRAASRSPMVAGPAESVIAGGSFLVETDPRGTR
jgi:hypothetical protein